MFAIQEKIRIQATEELPTKCDGQVGWVQKQWKSHPEFWTVLTIGGHMVVFHETQMKKLEEAVHNAGGS